MVDVAVQTVPAIHRLTVRPAGDDPRCTVLLQDAIDLGITTLRSVQIHDLVFVRGDVTERDRRQLQDILVDPLLQEASWNTFQPTTQHVVESALHSGVTDSVAHELHRVAARLGVTIEAVATGKRFELNGSLTHTDLDILVGKLLVNPVIENCAIDTAIIPAFADSGTSTTSGVSYVSIPSDASDDDLQKLNLQRGLAMDIEELRAVRDHYVSAGAVARDIELESIAQTWSEHCAHKTFRASITLDDGTTIPSLINQLRDTTEIIDAPYVVSSFVGNAGIISFVPGTTIALKCETHNHPSAIEPFGEQILEWVVLFAMCLVHHICRSRAQIFCASEHRRHKQVICQKECSIHDVFVQELLQALLTTETRLVFRPWLARCYTTTDTLPTHSYTPGVLAWRIVRITLRLQSLGIASLCWVAVLDETDYVGQLFHR